MGRADADGSEAVGVAGRRVATLSDRAGRVWCGCRGTARGTSTGRIPVHCVLSGHIPETLVQVERSWRRSGPLLIPGFAAQAHRY
jgi:hypothetical protein